MMPAFPMYERHRTFFRGALRQVVIVPLDRERDEAGIQELVGAEVLIDGKVHRVLGVERFMHMPPWSEGELVGLALED
jgi:hypothetical protein